MCTGLLPPGVNPIVVKYINIIIIIIIIIINNKGDSNVCTESLNAGWVRCNKNTRTVVGHERPFGANVELLYSPQCEQSATLCCCLWR
jgi:hypothetical protein